MKNSLFVSFEVRRYDGAKYAVVSSEGRTFDQVTGELVRKLLMYIGGSNEQAVAMGTAAPIIVTVYPRNDGVLSRRLVVAIRIPTSYQQEPPTPSDTTITFGGFAAESEYRAEALRLTRTLGETAPFQRKQYFCCSYDPPLKPYGRRNEIQRKRKRKRRSVVEYAEPAASAALELPVQKMRSDKDGEIRTDSDDYWTYLGTDAAAPKHCEGSISHVKHEKAPGIISTKACRQTPRTRALPKIKIRQTDRVY
ncbi:hypothetical protein F7725_003865 [Dissostichus mawsoni]|uniref:Heme-binding protein 1 n=1 Tax=Dissostichus mawsoni TaxID=36200 RepID=A0A7J5YE17_DISMA|nr:hypothetical protein F7725_003865 [Dissostichus mawsoni]